MNDCIKTMWETAAQRDDLWAQARYEKFAELIVQECAGLCSDPVVVLQHFGLDLKR
jgi:hypothetical protein